MVRVLFCAAGLSVLTATGCFAEPNTSPQRGIRLNPIAFQYARKLISEGHVVNDKYGNWSGHKASTVDENAFISQHGPEEYSQWHLGIDESHGANSKARYKFPFGDFKAVHRCALIAVQNRARQYGYVEIENAARELLELIKNRDHAQQKRRYELVSSH